MVRNNVKLDKESLINAEVKRLSEKYGKSFLDCSDISEITGLGIDNARGLMNGYFFPVITIGRRKVVSMLAFVTWQMSQ